MALGSEGWRQAHRRTFAWLVVFVALFASAVLAPARAENRVALVVGNSGYAVSPLANPRFDAEIIARALKAVGFSVTKLIDADQRTLRKAVIDFGRKARAPDTVGLFYYAGHAVQIDNENYLVPVGADIGAQQEVAVEGVNLGEILRTMERPSGGANIIILDACRNNPFAGSGRALGGGLAPVHAPAGTLIAFATAPGEVASDGEGTNSPYSAALAEALQAPGVPIEEVFRRTRRQVLAATANRQTPWEHSSLTVEFFFRPKAAEPEASRRGTPLAGAAERQLAEIEAWEKIKGTRDPEVLRAHIAAYPGGLFAELAQLRLAQLKGRPQDPGTIAGWFGSIFAPPAGDAEAERLLEEGLKLEARATPEGFGEAFKRYKAAAEKGLPAAMHQLARAFDKGQGTARSIADAARWYQKAADLGHAPAMASLGTMYEFADGVPVDLVAALRLYRLAAEKGDAAGMTSLAYLYEQGKGVARDGAEARRWYAMAAEKGDARAMYNLALMQARGDGGERDFAAAVRLLEGAIAKGHVGAHRELAFLYDEGRGVKRDAAAAARHLLVAFKAGHKDARVDLFERPEAWSTATRRAIQRKLAMDRLFAGRQTGFFGPSTRVALEAFARSN